VDVEEALASTKLLSSLDRRTIKRLAEQGKHRSYDAGETIIREGAPASALYIILSGKVHFEVAEGGSTPVATAGPGDFFGELALIEEHPRSATAIADEPTECILFVAWEFTALLKEFPEMAVPLMNALIARLHRREHHQL
jgi:CRP/FNR family transcriptional regulator, cyclic AMP receptor protein